MSQDLTDRTDISNSDDSVEDTDRKLSDPNISTNITHNKLKSTDKNDQWSSIKGLAKRISTLADFGTSDLAWGLSFEIPTKSGRKGPALGIYSDVIDPVQGNCVVLQTPDSMERYSLNGKLIQHRSCLPHAITKVTYGNIVGIGRVVVCGTQAGTILIYSFSKFKELQVINTFDIYSTALLNEKCENDELKLSFDVKLLEINSLSLINCLDNYSKWLVVGNSLGDLLIYEVPSLKLLNLISYPPVVNYVPIKYSYHSFDYDDTEVEYHGNTTPNFNSYCEYGHNYISCINYCKKTRDLWVAYGDGSFAIFDVISGQCKKYVAYNSKDNESNNNSTDTDKIKYNNNLPEIPEEHTSLRPPLEVQSNSVPLDVPPEVVLPSASSNYLSPKSRATPGDRGEGSDGSSIMGMMEDGSNDVLDVTSSGIPESDLRELEGELNREAPCNGKETRNATSTVLPESDLRELEGDLNREGSTPSDKSDDVTSSGEPVADLWEAEGEVNRGADGRNGPRVEGCLQDEDNVVLEDGIVSVNDLDKSPIVYPTTFDNMMRRSITTIQFSYMNDLAILVYDDVRVDAWDLQEIIFLKSYPSSILTCGNLMTSIYIYEREFLNLSLLFIGTMDGSIISRRIERSFNKEISCTLIFNLLNTALDKNEHKNDGESNRSDSSFDFRGAPITCLFPLLNQNVIFAGNACGGLVSAINVLKKIK